MILMKINEIKGDCKFAGYTDWITLTSFSFGTEKKIETAKRGGGNDIETGKGETQEFSVDKTADIATVDLMYSAIKQRATGDANTPFVVDIAFVEPRAYGDQDSKGTIKAYLKIRFGKALLKNWSLSGSDTDRATESLTFWYNQIAMAYDSSTDGKTYQTYGPRGWDQQEGKDWTPSGWK
jgi:type VI protein secretion system component Hcp